MTPKEMAKCACFALEEKKAEEITVIDISRVSVVADYFIIANGTNSNQVQAMVDSVDKELHEKGHDVKQIEGYRQGNWVLLDFGDIIVHVFDKENREYYDLERVWRDGVVIDIQDLNE